MLKQLCVAAMLVAVLPLWSQENSKVHKSLRYSCFHRPFFSIGVSTVRRDAFPAVDLTLQNSNGEAIGAGSSGKKIPHSHYGPVVEVPQHPEMSKTISAEICGAVQGDYEVTLREHDAGSRYRLKLRADDGKNGNLALDRSYITQSRICRFKIRVRFEDDNALIYFLDGKGNTTMDPPCLVSGPERVGDL